MDHFLTETGQIHHCLCKYCVLYYILVKEKNRYTRFTSLGDLFVKGIFSWRTTWHLREKEKRIPKWFLNPPPPSCLNVIFFDLLNPQFFLPKVGITVGDLWSHNWWQLFFKTSAFHKSYLLILSSKSDMVWMFTKVFCILEFQNANILLSKRHFNLLISEINVIKEKNPKHKHSQLNYHDDIYSCCCQKHPQN